MLNQVKYMCSCRLQLVDVEVEVVRKQRDHKDMVGDQGSTRSLTNGKIHSVDNFLPLLQQLPLDKDRSALKLKSFILAVFLLLEEQSNYDSLQISMGEEVSIAEYEEHRNKCHL
ncbi:unnamed protein product [Phytophthora fragariaefolia]|uniref:Unnamed protein product n=1 Tax=Phytophthora fragariaefolia TaxID=1490495 RepID=A0A9W6YBQ1_9STRA|nr:unnamed protein product [Phytophthora fragariaefolia]